MLSLSQCIYGDGLEESINQSIEALIRMSMM